MYPFSISSSARYEPSCPVMPVIRAMGEDGATADPPLASAAESGLAGVTVGDEVALIGIVFFGGLTFDGYSASWNGVICCWNISSLQPTYVFLPKSPIGKPGPTMSEAATATAGTEVAGWQPGAQRDLVEVFPASGAVAPQHNEC
jgi:hypothetical protein